MLTMICSHCSESIYEILIPPTPGDVIAAKHFKGINGYPSPKRNQEAKCPACRKQLFEAGDTKILTNEGWLPKAKFY